MNSSLRITTSPGSPWAPGRRDWDGRFESEQGEGPHGRLQQLRSRTAGGWRAYTPFVKVPENRVYVSVDGAEDFLHSFLASSGGRVVSDEATASGIEIGRPQITFRRIQVESTSGKLVASSPTASFLTPMDARPRGMRSLTSLQLSRSRVTCS